MMLNVNNTSNIRGGIGSTRSVNTSNTINGVTTELTGKLPNKCRKFVNVKKDDSISH